MATATWEIDGADHELRAKQADALWTLTRERYCRALKRMERAERTARAHVRHPDGEPGVSRGGLA